MKYIVYLTINLKTNKIYIGVHKCEDPSIFDGYLGCGIKVNIPSSYNNPKTPLLYAVSKYGTSSFRRTIIKVYNTSEEAYNLEELLVDYGFINRKDTYNSKLGGQGGCSSYTRINLFNLKGDLIKTWNSIVEASEFYNVSHTSICNASKFKGSSLGYYWSTNDSIDITEYSLNLGSTCYKYDAITGKYITFYNSVVEASKDNNITSLEIQRAIKGGYRVGNNYYSTLLLEEYNGKPKVCIKGSPIYVYSLSGEFIKKLANTNDIRNFFNISSTNPISISIRTGRPYKEYQISILKVNKMSPITNKRNISKKVGLYSLTGDLLLVYDSITSACNIYGSGVLKVLRGQLKQCKDFIFKYIS